MFDNRPADCYPSVHVITVQSPVQISEQWMMNNERCIIPVRLIRLHRRCGHVEQWDAARERHGIASDESFILQWINHFQLNWVVFCPCTSLQFAYHPQTDVDYLLPRPKASAYDSRTVNVYLGLFYRAALNQHNSKNCNEMINSQKLNNIIVK